MPLVDQFIPPQPQPQRVIRKQTAQPAAARPNTQRLAQASSKHPTVKRRVSGRWLLRRLPVVLVLLLLAGTTGSLVIGQASIAAYGLAALVLKIPSRTTFSLAVLLLLCVPILLVAMPEGGLAENCAVYAFLFLVIGTLSMALENRSQIAYSRRRT